MFNRYKISRKKEDNLYNSRLCDFLTFSLYEKSSKLIRKTHTNELINAHFIAASMMRTKEFDSRFYAFHFSVLTTIEMELKRRHENIDELIPAPNRTSTIIDFIHEGYNSKV